MKNTLILIMFIFSLITVKAQSSFIGVKTGIVFLPNENMSGIESGIFYSLKMNGKIQPVLGLSVIYSNEQGIFIQDYKGNYSILDSDFKLPSSPFNTDIEKKEYLDKFYGFKILKPKPNSYYIFNLKVGLQYELYKSMKTMHLPGFSLLFSYHDLAKYYIAYDVTYQNLSEKGSFLHYVPYYKRYDDLGIEVSYQFDYNFNNRVAFITNICGKLFTSGTSTYSFLTGLKILL